MCIPEAYDALEKRYDADVGRLTKELEKDRDGLDPESLGPRPPEELKDIADKSKKGDDGTSGSEHQIHRLEKEVEQLKAQLHNAESRIKASSPIQGKHSMDLQVLSPTRDSASMAKVIEKVSTLNEQILHAAVLFGDIAVFSPVTLTPEARKHHTETCGSALNSMLTRCLSHEASRKGAKGVNQFLARLVLRVLLANFLYLLVDTWEPAAFDLNEYIEGLYDKIRDAGERSRHLPLGLIRSYIAEEQSTSGHWKALTRKHTDVSIEVWKGKLLRRLDSICDIANWSIADKEGRSAFLQKLSTILIAAEDLRAAIGEGCVYVDIQIAMIPQGPHFRQDLMEDAYVDNGGSGARSTKGRPPSQEVVVGSVGLGLMRGSKDRLPNGNVKYHFVQPPKVAVLSTLLACCSTCSAVVNPRSASTSKAGSTTPAQAIPQGGSAGPGRPTGISGAKGPGASTGGDAGNVNRKTNTPAGQEKKG